MPSSFPTAGESTTTSRVTFTVVDIEPANGLASLHRLPGDRWLDFYCRCEDWWDENNKRFHPPVHPLYERMCAQTREAVAARKARKASITRPPYDVHTASIIVLSCRILLDKQSFPLIPNPQTQPI